MIIQELNPIGFGKFVNRQFDLASGLNIIYGANEAGKSTLIHFIEFMLYGAKKDGVKNRIYLPAHSVMKPWDTNEYSGRLLARLDNKRRLEILRNFDKDKERMDIFDPDLGKNLNDTFPVDSRDERLVARELFGMTRPVFLNTALVNQLSLKEGINDESNELTSLLMSAVSPKDADSNTARAINILSTALDVVGKTDRGKRSGELKLKIEKLEKEIKEAYLHRQEWAASRAKLVELERNERVTEKTLQKLENNLAKDEILYLRSALEKADKLEETIAEEEEQTRKYEKYKDFPLGNAELVPNLEYKKGEISKRLESVNQKVEPGEKESKELAEELRAYRLFRKLPEDSVDKIHQLKIQLQNAEKNIQEVRLAIKTEKDKNRDQRDEFNQLDQLFEALGENASNQLQKLNDEEGAVLEKIHELSNTSKELSDDISKKQANVLISVMFALVSSLSAVFISILSNIGVFSLGIFNYLFVLASVGFTGLAIVQRISAKKQRQREKQVNVDYNALLDIKKKLNKERSTILSLAGVQSIADFLKLEARFYHLKNIMTNNAILLLQKRLPKLEEEADEIAAKLLSRLQAVGLASGKSYPEERDIREYLDTIKKVKTIDQKLENKIEQVKSLIREKADLEAELEGINKELKDIYRGANVGKYIEFEKDKENKISYDKHAAALQRRKENLESLLSGRTKEEMRIELDRLESSFSGQIDADEVPEKISPDQVKMKKSALDRLKAEINTLKGSITRLESNLVDPGDLELELESAKEELMLIDKRRKVLIDAIHTVEVASESLHADFAPILNEKISKNTATITNNRYSSVMLDETFTLSVRSPENKGIIPVQNLSSGTRDQLYFSARIALLDALTDGNEQIPLLLDDSFIEYDESRTRNALNLLMTIAEDRQIIFFTCHSREVDLMQEYAAHEFNLLELD